ncbi:MAG TPA: CTP synthase [Gammaproteobacteria bacterium]|nr:CTP synthase [Gammaproteobacteria bacterium]
MKRIALVGDYSESVVAHRAIPQALKSAASELRADVTWEWLASRDLPPTGAARLEPYAGFWCVPGSPYENMQGVLDAIRFARVQKRPFLGTCGGFQHALLEYAQAVWDIEALHAETNPEAEDPVIAPLACSLVEVTAALRFERGSRLRAIYGRDSADEEYHCNYGLNPRYAERLRSGPLTIAARDAEGGVRAVELRDHPFFIGTLFQPERSALRGQTPPLVKAFVEAVARG